jgi:hypothetical protein
MPFSHENLSVYQLALAFNAKVAAWVDSWDAQHAICDHLPRAAEGVLECIATASASHSAMKQRSLDYAIGSTLECAACLDIAMIKRLPGADAMPGEKQELSRLVKMLVGLRRAWSAKTVREEAGEYDAGGGGNDGACDKAYDKGEEGRDELFHHEQLDMYRVGLEIIAAMSASGEFQALPDKAFGRLDHLLTSVVLNIAEGNGRFSTPDQRRFLATAHEASIKAAANLDLCVVRELLPGTAVNEWKMKLERVASMTAAMMGRLR